MRQRANVILMPVGNEEATNAVKLVCEVGDVGNDEINAQHLLIWEHQPGVDDDDVFAIFDRHHVLANLAQAAQWHDAYWTDPAVALGGAVALLLAPGMSCTQCFRKPS